MKGRATKVLKPILASVEDVRLKCDYFVDVQLWPLKHVLNPEGWLTNFTPEEVSHAAALLNAFLYFSEILVDTIYRSAFDDLSAHLRDASDTAFAVDTKWRAFRERVILTYSTGELPNPTDSGYLFARKARQILGVPENRIVPPHEALELMARDRHPVVFVDDFVGTGNQFIETWTRENQSGPLTGYSFATVSSLFATAQAFYCPLICTHVGYEAIAFHCSGVSLSPAHRIDHRYSAFDPDSLLWPAELASTSFEFLEAASKRAGIPDDVTSTQDWRGFNQLGLALAFFHSVPDATLPIFYWDQNGWVPLIRRA